MVKGNSEEILVISILFNEIIYWDNFWSSILKFKCYFLEFKIEMLKAKLYIAIILI